MTPSDRTLLVVDDDPGYRELLCSLLKPRHARVLCAASGEDALEALGRGGVDLVLLDMRMHGIGGLGVLERLAERADAPPVLVLTAFAEVEDAVRAMKLGAKDYLRKPVDLQELTALVERHLGLGAPVAATHDLPPDFVAESPAMRALLDELARVAPSEAPVLLSGESGTGKEELARLVHRWSPRAARELVAVNVTALPDTLLESELFGSAKGAYTGADRQRDGLVRAAQGGTLFLDEIGDMPLAAQPKLLRVLEEGAVRRVGEERAEPVDFRLVSATHRDLEEAVEQGAFRLDLYYRLAVVTLELPPLRERVEDVAPLARVFLREAGAADKQLSPAARERLEGYAWPGNIRELRNVVTRAAILAPGDRILPEHLPPTLRAAPAAVDDAGSLADLERQAILAALERHGGNRTHAARELGISRRKLLYRLKEYEQ
ncbi:MAG: sigma-54-dependent Fis family transcriptional regulator [Planctomycetes bacterium]|nr:sigma-54-dependent Fis family transcriptional regulator [Planctomycetota bacterium]